MIVLTEQEAAAVRGGTEKGYALEPVALADGTYVLPEHVIDDARHATHAVLLSALPCRSVAPEEFIRGEE